jgi:hypothetical protein
MNIRPAMLGFEGAGVMTEALTGLKILGQIGLGTLLSLS